MRAWAAAKAPSPLLVVLPARQKPGSSRLTVGLLNSLDNDEQDVLLALFRKITLKINDEGKVPV